jgi:radical SAM-linked protein
MRLFQRAFKRANLPLTHTQGFNPRPSVSIALPLSVGVESYCELLDFDLDGETVPSDEMKARLNEALVAGVRVLDVYMDGRKLRDLALLRSTLVLEYDRGVPSRAVEQLEQLFTRQILTVPKKTKNGIKDQDIISMIRRIQISCVDDHEIAIHLLACCQNPTLNPMQLIEAIKLYTPELAPDFAKCQREEIYDAQETVFR